MAPSPPSPLPALPGPTPPSRTGGGGRIRTYEGVSRQIYSLLPLTAWVPLRENEPRILISASAGVNEAGALFAYWRKSLPAICAASPVAGIHLAAQGTALGRLLIC